jgi:hypothetical protein
MMPIKPEKNPEENTTSTDEKNKAVHATGKPQKKSRLVQRTTALRGLSANPPRVSSRARRKSAEHDLLHDSGLPYETYGKELRKILCSIYERQDRLHDTLLLRLDDMEYRVDDLEAEIAAHREEMRR